MTTDEYEPDQFAYRFRVRVRPTNEAMRETRFENGVDAKVYMQSCMDATCVEYLQDNGQWSVWCQDGETYSHRPGHHVLYPYRGQREFKQRLEAFRQQHPTHCPLCKRLWSDCKGHHA